MHLYTADAFEGTLDKKQMETCNEGILKWIPKDCIMDLNLWEGDYLFLNRMYKNNNYFEIELKYKSGKLISYNIKEV